MDDIRELEEGDEVWMVTEDSYYGWIEGTVVGYQQHDDLRIVDVQTVGDFGDGPVASKDYFLIDLLELRQNTKELNDINVLGLTVNEYTEEIGGLDRISVHDPE